MRMLQKIIDCKIFEICQEKVFDEVYFSKVTSVQSTHWNSNVKILHHTLFLNYEPKLAALKRIFWEKSAQPIILSKSGAHVRPFCRGAENSIAFTGKPPWWTLKVESLEFNLSV